MYFWYGGDWLARNPPNKELSLKTVNPLKFMCTMYMSEKAFS